MHPTLVALYRDLHERHWWCRAREEFLMGLLAGLDLGASPSILDIGCGDGLLFDRLGRWGHVEGIESDPLALSPESSHRGRIHLGSLETFRSERRFALVLFFDVLEHLDDPKAALLQARALLAPGGRIVATVPALRSMWTSHDDLNRHRTRYRKAEFLALTESAGLRTERCRYFFHWLCVPKLLVRWKEALLGARPAPPRVPPEPFNALFYFASRLEERLLGRLGLPFGTSLLWIGRPAADPA